MPSQITVTVKPGSKSPGIEVRDGIIIVRVRERAVEGAANEAVLRATAKWLDVPPSSLQIVRGTKSRKKLIELTTLTPLELEKRLNLGHIHDSPRL